MASLPAAGTRVGPSNLPNMATISTPNTRPAIQFLPGSNHWRIMGIEITTSYVSTTNLVFFLVSAGLLADVSTAVSVASQLPACIILDRTYIHGLPTTNTQHAVQMDAASFGIVDSYCDEIHWNGGDSQCFVSWNGVGPYLLQNDFIQASTEDVVFGGADPAIANLIPSDITIVGNLIQKNLSWRGEAAPYNWTVKNLVEFKNGQRILIDGNVIQNVWNSGQFGFAILLTPRNQSGKCPWCVVQDVTITRNIIQHAAGGTEVAGGDNNYPSLPSARVLVSNNLYNDINGVNWANGTGGGWLFEIASNSTLPVPHDLTFDHNTGLPDNRFLELGDTGVTPNVAITNNISNYGLYGIYGTGVGTGQIALTTFISSYTYNDLILMNASGTSDGSLWPSGTYWSTPGGVQFTDASSGNYQLLSTSPYHNAGTDGKDVGVWDWTCLNADTAAALAGTFVPGSGCDSAAMKVTIQPPTVQPPTGLQVSVQ